MFNVTVNLWKVSLSGKNLKGHDLVIVLLFLSFVVAVLAYVFLQTDIPKIRLLI